MIHRFTLTGIGLMARVSKPGWCNACNRQVAAVANRPSHLLHLLLTIITAGLWGIVWILAIVTASGWKCSLCGLDASMKGRPGA